MCTPPVHLTVFCIFFIIGLFMLQLFDDLHNVFAHNYLHRVDSDKVLICEVFAIARKAGDYLLSPDLPTPKACEFNNNLLFDDHSNAVFNVNNKKHQLRLNYRVTGRGESPLFLLFDIYFK